MWKFIKEYSYDAVKMFVTQCAISIFGLALVVACLQAENEVLTLISSIGAVLFYLFLLYTTVWEMGAKDGISVQYGHKQKNSHLGLQISFIANLPNIILAFGFMIGKLFEQYAVMKTIGNICGSIAMLIEAMYSGILSMDIKPAVVENNVVVEEAIRYNDCWIFYFIIILPALLISWLGYWLGTKNIRILGPLSAPANQKKPPKGPHE